jgi:hypothetical protein
VTDDGESPPPSTSESPAWLALTVLLGLGALVVGGMVLSGDGPGASWSNALEWRPAIGAGQPWRWWTAAWVHWSGQHLAVNLIGTGVIGFLGWRARMPREAALAWFIAWPLTHALMGLPEARTVAQTLQHYGGLSGVLHAGVIVLGLSLLRTRAEAAPPGRPRLDAPTTQMQPTLAPSRTTEGPWAMTSLEEAAAWQGLDEAPPRRGLAPLTGVQAARHRWVGLALVSGTLAKVLLEAPWDLALRPNALLGIQVAPLAHACGIAAGALAWAGLALALAWRARAARHGA